MPSQEYQTPQTRSDTPVRIAIERTRIYPQPARRGPAWYWLYQATGPDGSQFDNTSFAELKRVLRRRYGAVEARPEWAFAPLEAAR